MRVIAGEAKGRRLAAVPSSDVRPMTDQIREALFSTLGPRVPGAELLDLYAGSGSVGIEALSRGAAHATFVESGREAAATIRVNLLATGFTGRSEVVAASVEDFLAGGPSNAYDLVMIDPPFPLGLPSDVLEALAKGFLKEGSTAVLRVASRMTPIDVPSPFVVVSERTYGDSTLLYLSVEEEG